MIGPRRWFGVLVLSILLPLSAPAADAAKPEASVKEAAPAARSWKDWNAAPTPVEGRRIEDLYSFGEFYCTDANKYLRAEFELGAEPSDAWLVFYSYLDVAYARKISYAHEIHVNDTLVHAYPKPGETYERQPLAVVQATGLRKGKNVLWAKTLWSSIKLIANAADGSQAVVDLSPAWRASDERHPGWEAPGYSGPSAEMVYRLGREGYHCNILPYMCHPYAGLIDLHKDQEIPVYKAGGQAKWTISIPAFFYGADNPELQYVVERCFDRPGVALQGRGTLLEAKAGKRVYEMAFAVPPVGAYDVTIRFGDQPAMAVDWGTRALCLGLVAGVLLWGIAPGPVLDFLAAALARLDSPLL